jgi:hypothetical protein
MNLSAIPALSSNACTLGTAGSFGNDRITQNVYDVAGQLLVIKRAVGTPRAQDYVAYTYTLNGKQATATNLGAYTYDNLGRRTNLARDTSLAPNRWSECEPQLCS